MQTALPSYTAYLLSSGIEIGRSVVITSNPVAWPAEMCPPGRGGWRRALGRLSISPCCHLPSSKFSLLDSPSLLFPHLKVCFFARSPSLAQEVFISYCNEMTSETWASGRLSLESLEYLNTGAAPGLKIHGFLTPVRRPGSE